MQTTPNCPPPNPPRDQATTTLLGVQATKVVGFSNTLPNDSTRALRMDLGEKYLAEKPLQCLRWEVQRSPFLSLVYPTQKKKLQIRQAIVDSSERAYKWSLVGLGQTLKQMDLKIKDGKNRTEGPTNRPSLEKIGQIQGADPNPLVQQSLRKRKIGDSTFVSTNLINVKCRTTLGDTPPSATAAADDQPC